MYLAALWISFYCEIVAYHVRISHVFPGIHGLSVDSLLMPLSGPSDTKLRCLNSTVKQTEWRVVPYHTSSTVLTSLDHLYNDLPCYYRLPMLRFIDFIIVFIILFPFSFYTFNSFISPFLCMYILKYFYYNGLFIHFNDISLGFFIFLKL